MLNNEAEILTIRKELEMVQRALKLQTKRCQHLVTEYTRRLQEKEQQYQSEKLLRDDQLAKVLRALLIFEARLKQEQKFISHQLSEKDYIIRKQSNDIKKLLAGHYCKNCKTYYSPSSNLESLDSSSEYVITDYQSSNFESLDSSSETYATLSEKEYNRIISTSDQSKSNEVKNGKKLPHRKSAYFEALKLRNDNVSPFSNEDNTSNDYDNLDSLPAESIISEKFSTVSETFADGIVEDVGSDQQDSSTNVTISEYNTTVIARHPQNAEVDKLKSANEEEETFKSKITETIPVFDGDNEANDNWYASASDQDDEEHRDIYRNNPVLECMNQILLQNINDSLNSPPKTPNVERKVPKRVKFSDEEDNKNDKVDETTSQTSSNYYETPIQKPPNFYESPQSIYSNDYEQILSKSSDSIKEQKEPNKEVSTTNINDYESPNPGNNHFYIDMDVKDENEDQKPVRKTKILRTPPALPPKPSNLTSKYKISVNNKRPVKKINLSDTSLEPEPDYCSISELNLPTRKVSNTVSVVAEINGPPNDSPADKSPVKKNEKEQVSDSHYDPINDVVPSLVVRKNIEKFNVQVAKQTHIKTPPKTKISDIDIPKLPQVSEIIIPDEAEPKQKQEERISYDNYVKNNSQILKQKQTRHPIVVGSSVSDLITGFNNQQLLFEIKQKQGKPHDKASFTNFENSQKERSADVSFECFDLSQNFEEFKLDDCDIEDETPSGNQEPMFETKPLQQNSTRVELIRATNDIIPKLNVSSVEQLRRKLELQRSTTSDNEIKEQSKPLGSPTYEHFLECTGLSSKSILTPSRLLSNHRSMLKPKDVKLRSKVVKSSGTFERQGSNTIKYWSEPYI